MRGHIRPRGAARWEIFYDLGADPVSGRRHLRSKTIHGSRGDAERALTVILGRVAAGTQADPQTVTVGEFARHWLELVEGTVRPTTLDSYRQKLKLACTMIGDRKLRDLTGETLTGVYRALPGSAQTVVHVHRVLHRMLSDAVRWGVLGQNPAANALPPKILQPRLTVWSGPEVGRFLEQVKGDRLVSLWRLACTTGMRRGEVCGLRWRSVDLRRGVLLVEQSRVMVAGHPAVGTPKTRAGRRWIALDPDTVAVLDRHRASQEEDRGFFGPGYQDEGWVFCWDDGRPYSPDWVSRRFVELAQEAGLPRIRFHDLRHTFATLALEAGISPKVVADRLGHAGIAITLDTYTHHSDELDRQAAEKVSGLFS